MAKVRIGFSTQFELENELVGIGTDNPTNTLQALGNIKSTDAKVVGVSTFTTFDGFTDTKLRLEGSAGAKQHTTSGEIIIEGEVTVSTGTTFTSGPENLTVTDNFTLPGISDDKPTVGTMRFNENLASLEFYTGSEWRAVNSYVDNGNRGRAVFAGGYDTNPHGAATKNQIDYFNLSTGGNAINFGEMTTAVTNTNGCGNSIRGLIVSGYTDGDIMQYITIASEGNTIDFGNRTVDDYGGQAVASSTRAVFVGSSGSNIMDYVEIMTTGNAVDFGDCGTGSFYRGHAQSPTRGVVYAGKYSGVYGSAISSFLIASKGNSEPWGEAASSNHNYVVGQSNSVRGIFSMGAGSPTNNGTADKKTESFELSSAGFGVDFGELAVRHARPTAAASLTRVVIAGGQNTEPSAYQITTCESVTIATRGSAEYFGDLTVARDQLAGLSDCHGGLGGF